VGGCGVGVVCGCGDEKEKPHPTFRKEPGVSRVPPRCKSENVRRDSKDATNVAQNKNKNNKKGMPQRKRENRDKGHCKLKAKGKTASGSLTKKSKSHR